VLRFEDIRFDCALYSGYKPCRHGNECRGCPHYTPRGDTVPDADQPVIHAPECGERAAGDPFTILIIKTGAMGDVLRTTTLLPGLARQHPDSSITWVTDISSVPLLAGNPLISELLAFGPESCALLESRDFDLLLNFEKEKEPLALAGRIRARLRMGFAPTHWGTPTVFNPESRYGLLLGLSDELKFRVNHKSYPQIISEMACVEYRRDPYVLCPGTAANTRRGEIEYMLGETGRLRVGLNTGCGNVFMTKRWTSEGWIGLATYLQDHTDAHVLLLGGRAEAEMNREILARCDGVTDTGCDNPLERFIGVVDACDVIVTSDSLGMHIAIALGKYVVALFGSTCHSEVDLYDRGEKIVTDFPCSPCYLKTCDKKPTCMEALRPETVGLAVIRGLERLKPASR
jgi:ADP-heptose:LPS heptosyltransferase